MMMKTLSIVCMVLMSIVSQNTFAKGIVSTPQPMLIPAFYYGGHSAIKNYFDTYLSYPSCARETGIEGKVTISFFVLPDGSIYRPRVEKGIQEKCDQVALQAIKDMPTWVPAMHKGLPVASKNSITIHFRLTD